MINKEDAYGNRLYQREDRVYLKLKDQRTRMIGKLGESKGKTIYKKYVKPAHIMKINKSIGVCHALLDCLNEDDWVVVSVENQGVVKLQVKDVFKYGGYLHFKKQGFEKQIFVPLKDWEY